MAVAVATPTPFSGSSPRPRNVNQPPQARPPRTTSATASRGGRAAFMLRPPRRGAPQGQAARRVSRGWSHAGTARSSWRGTGSRATPRRHRRAPVQSLVRRTCGPSPRPAPTASPRCCDTSRGRRVAVAGRGEEHRVTVAEELAHTVRSFPSPAPTCREEQLCDQAAAATTLRSARAAVTLNPLASSHTARTISCTAIGRASRA